METLLVSNFDGQVDFLASQSAAMRSSKSCGTTYVIEVDKTGVLLHKSLLTAALK